MTVIARCLSALCVVLLFSASVALGQGASVSLGIDNHDGDLPVEITSEELSLDQRGGSATFTGNVIVGQGELIMTCDRMVVEYGPDEAGDNAIKIIRMFGGVTFVGTDEAAESDSAVYTLDDEVIVLTGNVLVTQGSTALSADRLTYNLQSGAGRMEGNVKTILNPGRN